MEIKSRGHVRRSRLYYLRDLRGKKARLRSKLRDLSALVPPEPEELEEQIAETVGEVSPEPEGSEDQIVETGEEVSAELNEDEKAPVKE